MIVAGTILSYFKVGDMGKQGVDLLHTLFLRLHLCPDRNGLLADGIQIGVKALLPVVSQSIGERPFPFIAFRRLRNTFERLCHTIEIGRAHV